MGHGPSKRRQNSLSRAAHTTEQKQHLAATPPGPPPNLPKLPAGIQQGPPPGNTMPIVGTWRSANLWSSIFGWEALFRWDVMGALVPSGFIAVGVGMLGVEWFPNNLLISQVCFAIAAILVIVKTIGHATRFATSLGSKIVFCSIICGFTAIITILMLVSIQAHKPRSSYEIESNLYTWLTHLNVSKVARRNEPVTFFTYIVTLRNGTLVDLRRYKEGEGRNYISFQAGVSLTAEQKTIIANLSPEKAQQVADEVQLEVSRLKIGYNLIGPPLSSVEFIRAVLIEKLTKESFVGYLDEIDSDVTACRQAIKLSLDRVAAK